ncbi:hypothetical protein [Iningainema tapete]|nr:hypothetical protein [Iningainema tapete]
MQKICQHKPGEKWTDGCCSPNPSVDSSSRSSNEPEIEFAFEQSLTAQTEVQKHSADAELALDRKPALA